jgi:hypothetical protein
MKIAHTAIRTFALSLLFTGALAQAATVTGTVTDKTTGKPAAGDTVVLVDVQAGMGEVAKATTDANGKYSLREPGSGPYLVRVTHQGSPYFIAAPQGGGPGDIPVFDVAPKVQGVSIEADVLQFEADNGQLTVNERYFVHNNSSPPLTQWSPKTFEVILPADATIDGAQAQRPTGLPTTLKLDPDGPKGHYSFNFPIQPDDGEKDTLFLITYHLPYSDGKYTFKTQVTLPADNVGVLLPKSMTFTPGSGASFKNVPDDPSIQTFVAKNATPGKPVEFTVSGTGSVPREQQGAPQPAGMPGQDAGAPQAGPSSTPGGGIGAPIGEPDPLSKYKWWILGALALLLAAGAAFFLRKPPGGPQTGAAQGVAAQSNYTSTAAASTTSPATFTGYASVPAQAGTASSSALLNALKEELFTLESEKINGTITPEEYASVKSALEIVLKRALNRK